MFALSSKVVRQAPVGFGIFCASISASAGSSTNAATVDQSNDDDSTDQLIIKLRDPSERDIFTLQDAYNAPADPTPAMTFSLYGVTDFDVQYWNGGSWVTVPGGSVSGNNLVWRKFTFPPLATSAIRVNVRKAPVRYSRITEIEAY